VFCGHVHEPVLYTPGAVRPVPFRPVPGVAIPVPPRRRWLAVVGSAGQPRDGNTAASYAMLDTERTTLTFHRVPYDWRAAAGKIRAAGLPESLARRLERGE
jgi:diadenosine tetraphosphatase ApaH/serine/threonine PP2A family protein phosphatase